jgi:cystathionine beta-synthase
MKESKSAFSPRSKPELHVFESVEELIGRTPLVRLRSSLENIPPGRWLKSKIPEARPFTLKSTVYAKVEFFNPGGSVKDRIARNMLEKAEQQGLLKPGGVVVEATSGNTGAGLAVMAASKGYKTIFVMPDKMSAEKVNALRAFGAKVVITPTSAGPDTPDYYANVAKRIASEIPGAFLANQFFNPDNPGAHFESTGPEIWEQMEGKIDAFAAGIGTGGTLSGTARYLKSKNPKIRIVAVDPYGSIYTGLIQEGKESPAGSYLVEGVGEDMVPGSMDLKMPTDVVTVFDDESFAATRMLAQKEGLLVGGSCGTAFMGLAQWLALHESKGGAPLRAVVLLPDSGSRYLSKIFNHKWLVEKNVNTGWGEMALGGEVEYLPSAVKIEGV